MKAKIFADFLPTYNMKTAYLSWLLSKNGKFQGRELIMELDDHDLRLIDPDSLAVLHTQPIHQIRVWGVGRDNGR